MSRKLNHIPFAISIFLLFVTSCSPTQAITPAAAPASSPTAASPSAYPSGTSDATVYPSPTTDSAYPSPPSTTTNPSSTSAPTGTSGTESNAIQFTVVPDKSQASYRVREQLASLSFPSDAIGTTNEISGTITLNPDGTVVSSQSKFEVNLQSLHSDRSQRDNFVGRNVLLTSQYPSAVFVPSQITGLPSPLPQSGDVAFKLTGNLTLLGVTKPVEWDVTGTVQGNQVTAKATTSFKFEDFNLTQPRVPVVLSVVDNITLEIDLTLQRVGS